MGVKRSLNGIHGIGAHGFKKISKVVRANDLRGTVRFYVPREFQWETCESGTGISE